MSSPFLGEIKMFSGGFAPQGWAFCNGQTLSINQNQALFALIGTLYGGNGTSTFALPNLQCCVPLGQGQGAGLSNYVVGQTVGTANTSLTVNNMPAHTHALNGSTAAATTRTPSSSTALGDVGRNHSIYDAGSSPVPMNAASIGQSGNNIPISNLQPYLTLTFIIALEGIFPSRN
jgi:microcystin-dependent protein